MSEEGAVYATFLQLEREARDAENEDALRFVMVNQTRRLLAFRQAILVRHDGSRVSVAAISNVPVIDHQAPLASWIVSVLKVLRPDPARGAERLDPAALPESLRQDWALWWPPEALALPLITAGSCLGTLILVRDVPFQAAEKVLGERLSEAYAHAWNALGSRSKPWRWRGRRAIAWGLLAVGLGTGLAWPVPQSALAPVEIVPRDPWVVAAPLEGVVREILIDPNQGVRRGDPLFRFEEAPLRAKREVAAKQLALAEADWRLAQQAAFRDTTRKGEVALKEATVTLRATELAYAEELLGRALVTAPTDGVAVFADRDDWTGRPVAVGERVMVVADPTQTEARIHLPVSDAIVLEPGARVRLFLAIDPLHPVEAVLRRASYDAEPTPDGILGYRIEADFSVPLRLGLQGTAKLYGTTAPFAFTLLRRPIAGVRQFLGM
ncbi:efflux RND transporter periplasmic adaptor subunit [Pararhodospirillum photometricum]|uniref:Membrane-fusion protein n=1 Tax=Pararhodospirillum photometricum DSM 122 TaxID=1150469 RepID=H6SM43_PARPM|nr:HlyD family efflux transporter periplasmic adaptor subunit [Pararhodospirillum photometricum]CCG09058.1 Membrane-fusion protein [Pararhodospirillum photometricum DSM 122]